MKKKDKENIIKRYDERLKDHGADIKALASGTEERRRLRYQVLLEAGIKSGMSVLDLGCGFGDLYAYINEKGFSVDYYGMDINERLIDEAKRRYPDANFLVGDVFENDPGSFDLILSTSTFNLPLEEEDNYGFVERLFKKLYERSKVGFAVDFLSNYVDYESDEAFHYSPEKVFSIAKQISKRVSLRHDHPLFEFCVYVYKDFEGWRKK